MGELVHDYHEGNRYFQDWFDTDPARGALHAPGEG